MTLRAVAFYLSLCYLVPLAVLALCYAAARARNVQLDMELPGVGVVPSCFLGVCFDPMSWYNMWQAREVPITHLPMMSLSIRATLAVKGGWRPPRWLAALALCGSAAIFVYTVTWPPGYLGAGMIQRWGVGRMGGRRIGMALT